ncbi:CRISPR-associated endonuclease Cas3'' [Sphingobium amiense]|nr:CRISPR-associated endonuclease Cas3'' [Sphingobium amiense]
MEIFAHSVDGRPEAHWEPLSHHLSQVGHRAAAFASLFGAADISCAMGLLHDIGKMSESYQNYIRSAPKAGGPKGPDHSSAGAKEAARLYQPYLGRIMAFGLAGHHAGLMDGGGHEGGNLSMRLTKSVEDYTGWEDHVLGLPGAEVLTTGLPRFDRNRIDATFSPSFFVRMLFSCLVDADFLATEAFLTQASGEPLPARGGVITADHLAKVRTYMAGHRRCDTPLNRLRSQILDHANGKAGLPTGLFTMTVPTGGGKTLTSLSFAMEHAAAHDLRRIIYVIPFTSIIEQTAEIFRKILGDEDVLEHHSSFDWDRREPARENDEDDEGPAGLAKLRRDAQNWDAPLIVTTAVQFFESLFAARTSKARKLHNLAKSVIILDEAQSIPIHLLRPCMAAIDELARNYGATVILCTATQPALRVQDGALPRKTRDGHAEGLEIGDDRELAPDPQGLYKQLRRVRVEWRHDPVSDAEIAARFAAQPQMLCIVNSRAHARDLFEAIEKQDGAAHLTTLMCARHRRAVLADLRQRLAARLPVRLVATSLIEAGVDVDFPEVWRAVAGLSNIAQAAGRCNREGRIEGLGRTVVFEPAEVEGRKPVPRAMIPFYQAAKNAERKIMRDPDADILGLEAVREYYRWLYWEQGYAALDKARLPDGSPIEIIAAIRDSCRRLEFPFARIAQAFRMIDDVMDPVIVPWGATTEEKASIDALIAEMKDESRPFLPSGAQRRLQQYIVPVPSGARQTLLASGAAQAIRAKDYGDSFVLLENPSLYDERFGLRLDDPTWRTSESNIM